MLSLTCTIGLGICHRNKILDSAVLLAKVMELCITKLVTIICNYNSRKIIPTNNRFLDKISRYNLGDVGEKLGFNLLSEVINCH